MPEVTEELMPRDGLTRAKLKFVGFEITDDNLVQINFAMTNEEGDFATQFPVLIHTHMSQQNTDWLIAQGHRQLRDILRQWLYETDIMARAYERKPPEQTK